MSTVSTDPAHRNAPGHVLSVSPFAIAAGVTAAVVFVLCWLGTFIPLSSPTHAYITLFTNADPNSTRALVAGTSWSLLFGFLVGVAFALIYNATAALDRN